jgi:chromosome partitioning protein
MAKCIAVTNQKGGVGKTTTAVNLSASLAYYGQEVLLIDLDPQANATSGLGFDKRNLKGSIYDVLIDEKPLSEVILSTSVEWLELVGSHIDLIGAELELAKAEGREQRLRQSLQKFDRVYKYILFDCPPSLSLITINALCAAQSVLIPIQCEYYALEGLSQLIETVFRVKQSMNPAIEIEGVLLTMVDSRIKLANDVIAEVKKVFKDKVYRTMIPRNIRLAESPGFGKPVLKYDFSSKGAQSYLQFAREFLERDGIAIGAAMAEKKSEPVREVRKEIEPHVPAQVVEQVPAQVEQEVPSPAPAVNAVSEQT